MILTNSSSPVSKPKLPMTGAKNLSASLCVSNLYTSIGSCILASAPNTFLIKSFLISSFSVCPDKIPSLFSVSSLSLIIDSFLIPISFPMYFASD